MTNDQMSKMLESMGNELDLEADDLQGYVAGILFCVAASILDGSVKELAMMAFNHSARRLRENSTARN